MIKFKLYNEGIEQNSAEVYINPTFVSSIIVTEMRRAYSGSSPVAIIKMSDGDKHTVYDASRIATKLIMEARAELVEKR